MHHAHGPLPHDGAGGGKRGGVVAPDDDRQPASLEHGSYGRGRVARVLLVPPGDGAGVPAVHDPHATAGEEVPAEIEVVVRQPAREVLRLLAHRLRRLARRAPGRDEVARRGVRHPEHGDVGVQEIEVGAARRGKEARAPDRDRARSRCHRQVLLSRRGDGGHGEQATTGDRTNASAARRDGLSRVTRSMAVTPTRELAPRARDRPGRVGAGPAEPVLRRNSVRRPSG